MKAEIVATGTELLLGEIVDLNSPYLAGQLSALGVDLYWISTVGDNLGRMTEVLRRAWQRSDLIITTGGLGPTQGDITREAVAALLGEDLQVDPSEEQRLRCFFSRRGWDMPQSNIKQAACVASAAFLPNPQGTAPGWWVEREGKVLVTLPGPPDELHAVWEKEAVPRLKRKLGDLIILSRVLKTFGISEAKLSELVGDLASSANPTVATYAKADGIHLRITAKAASLPAAGDMVKAVEAQVRAIVGDAIWGVDAQALEEVVGRMLSERGMTLAVMESCTGGMLAATITNVPGSSAYFIGGVISYSNQAKASWGVDPALLSSHGAVSAEAAQAMATAVRRRMAASIGIGITGVAGPDSMEGKPPGTVFIGVDDGHQPRVVTRVFPGNRQRVRERASTQALVEVRKTLLGRQSGTR